MMIPKGAKDTKGAKGAKNAASKTAAQTLRH
jgi:hypothetical protein